MSRSTRQSKILDIIAGKDVETQEELVAELAACGISVTQATISRDIKELGLVKTLSANNKYKYTSVKSSDIKISSATLYNSSSCSICRFAIPINTASFFLCDNIIGIM